MSKKTKNNFDIIVIGAGHAGLEASFIATKFKLKVGLFNLNERSIANLPCNPSIGGPAKGVVTREIDVLGGMQAIAVDETKIQIKKLNTSKGPGVWCYRAQIDKNLYHKYFLDQIDANPLITLIYEEVIGLQITDSMIKAVETINHFYSTQAVIITTGTYLKAALFNDKKIADSGPDNNPSSNFLSDFLRSMKFELLRLKTGTPPRIWADSINFSELLADKGNEVLAFSLVKPKYLPLEQQVLCYLTYTSETTKKIILESKHLNGLYNGAIKGVGPRYCPSIEDKILRFPHREKHQVFIEPVTKDQDYYYLAGLSTSFNPVLQEKIVHSVPGLKNARFKSYAYAIEYDAINPQQLYPTLETKKIVGLYFAGQINGTSGYEEAAAQGLIAGINAALKIQKQEPFILKRDEAYIGVMIDDLVNKGVSDPYRLLTSRAEHRLYLRNDNADDRLIKYSEAYNLVSPEYIAQYKQMNQSIKKNYNFLNTHYAPTYNLLPGTAGPFTLKQWLNRVDSDYQKLLDLNIGLHSLNLYGQEKLLIEIKYEGYISAQNLRLKELIKWTNFSLQNINDYNAVKNLSFEAVEKLNLIRPLTFAQAQNISGVNINDLMWIKIHLKKYSLH